jgi:hypothetical protein
VYATTASLAPRARRKMTRRAFAPIRGTLPCPGSVS